MTTGRLPSPEAFRRALATARAVAPSLRLTVAGLHVCRLPDGGGPAR
jgi:hypothetical protein